MKKLLILWLITFSSVLFAQDFSTKSVIEREDRCNKKEYFNCEIAGLMYDKGNGVTQDKFKAFELYQKACDGNPNSCSNLAILYDEGQGVRQDKFKAIELYQKACNGKNAIGCNNLGVMYERGEGVRQDKSKALSFYGKACDLKNELGCENYAKMKN